MGINDAIIGFCKPATTILFIVGGIAAAYMFPLLAAIYGAFGGACMMALSENNIAHRVGVTILQVAFYGALFAGFMWLLPPFVRH